MGAYGIEKLKIILPHEHVFTDLRNYKETGYAESDTEDVVRIMKPELERAKESGISIIVEATPIGVGRRADILKAVSESAGFPLIVPTGVYRDPWIPEWVIKAHSDELKEWMLGELTGEIEKTGVQAGWIKLSAGDQGITTNEAKVLKAAAAVGVATNSVIGSHTVKGIVVREQLDMIEKNGYTSNRFIWIHAQAEPDFSLHVEMAKRGAWIEYDSIGYPGEDEKCIEFIVKMLELGLESHILLSQDRGWYDPAKNEGGTPLSFSYIIDSFLPKLKAAEINEETIFRLMTLNPFAAFSR